MEEKRIEISESMFLELVSDSSKLLAIEAYTKGTRYSIDRQTIADICGFELKSEDD